MITETGHVVAIDKDGLWVETLKKSACGKCAAKSICGSKVLADYQKKDITHIKAFFTSQSESIDWSIGDIVKLGLEETGLLMLAVMAYVIPLLIMIIAIFISHQLLHSEIFDFIAAMIGLTLGGISTKFFMKYSRKKQTFQPTVLSKVN